METSYQSLSLIEALTRQDSELDQPKPKLEPKLESDSEEETTSKIEKKKKEDPEAFNKWLKEKEEDEKEEEEEEDPEAFNKWLEEEDSPEGEKKWYDDVVTNLFKNSVDSFKKARQLYNIVSSGEVTTSYFYRLNEKRKLQTGYKKLFNTIKDSIVITSSEEENKFEFNAEKAKSLLNQIQQTSNIAITSIGISASKKIAAYLLEIGYLEEVKNILEGSSSFNKKSKKLQKYNDEIEKKINFIASGDFFNVENGMELEHNGAIYHPKILHTWGVNFSWLLAHLRKGSKFKIMSKIIGNRLRQSPGVTNNVSAFALEICTCLKAGYELKSIGGIITLEPPPNFSPSTCISSGKEGDGIHPFYKEADDIYQKLEAACSTRKDFTFSLKEGLKEKPEHWSDLDHWKLQPDEEQKKSTSPQQEQDRKMQDFADEIPEQEQASDEEEFEEEEEEEKLEEEHVTPNLPPLPQGGPPPLPTGGPPLSKQVQFASSDKDQKKINAEFEKKRKQKEKFKNTQSEGKIHAIIEDEQEKNESIPPQPEPGHSSTYPPISPKVTQEEEKRNETFQRVLAQTFKKSSSLPETKSAPPPQFAKLTHTSEEMEKLKNLVNTLPPPPVTFSPHGTHAATGTLDKKEEKKQKLKEQPQEKGKDKKVKGGVHRPDQKN